MSGCILVVGMPRSGTTWVGKLFDSHPDTLYRHEPDSVHRLSLALYPDVTAAPQYRDQLQRFVASLPAMRASEVVGKQPLFAKSYHGDAALLAYRASAILAKIASRVQRNMPCPYRPSVGGQPQVRVVWKSIESPGRLGVCMQALPDARAIHLMRHPCGYIASHLRGDAQHRFRGPSVDSDDPWVLRMLLATRTGKACALTLNEVKRLTHEERLAWRWVLTQEKILADVAHDERVLSVRYEDVCADPLTMTQRMFAFTGLHWHRQTEAFVQASTQRTQHVADTDYYSVFKPSRGAAERWRAELEPAVIERIMAVLRASSLARFYPDDAALSATLPELMT